MKFELKSAVSCLGLSVAMFTAPAVAQTAQPAQPAPAAADTGIDPTAGIVVTGLRRSLADAEAIKKRADGIVDAITASDIGKFPDTNLAEAIQRIPGVTIDRDNNEGSKITVRGFGPEYNLITLNGRSMPGIILGNQESASRSFNLEELSADAISGVSVSKTGRADLPSGGIGATVDVTTARPFDYNGFKAAFQIKGTDDTSWRSGTKITPEVSGMVSDVFADGKIGVMLNGSYSERDSNQEFAFVGGWLEDQVPTPQNGMGALPAGVTSNQTTGTHNYEPQSMQWGIDTHHRTRVNGQAVIQFKPTDTLVITTDYTYALYKDHMQRSEYSAWYGYGASLYNGTISPDGTLNNFTAVGNDLAYDAFDDQIKDTMGSTGVNLKWKPSAAFEFEVDGHHSIANSGGGAAGDNDFAIVGPDPALSLTKTFNGTGTVIPLVNWTYQAPYTSGNMNTSTVTPLFSQVNNNIYRNQIDEWRMRGRWTNQSDSWFRSVEAGFQYKNFQTRAAAYSSGTLNDGFYASSNDGVLPPSAFTKISTCSILQGVSGGGCQQQVPYFYTFNPAQVANAFAGQYPGNAYVLPSTPLSDDRIDEKTYAGYVEAHLQWDIGDKVLRAFVGGRFEHTSVVANSLQQVPTGITWENPTEYSTNFANNAAFSNVGSSYNEFLPNVDLNLDVTSNFKLRASYSKTITRSDLTQLIGTTSVSTTPKPGARTATEGNPGLLPYSSQNFDFSSEWYYKRDSYISFNAFFKRVSNFLTETTTPGTINGANGKPITDPGAGAIEQQAVAELQAKGVTPVPSAVFAQMEADTGQTAFIGQPNDPAVIWEITQPTNANAVNVWGIEMSGQHMFGQSGFGIQANVSLPWSNVHFNPLEIGTQFAVPGLSKSYNIVGIFEKFGFQGRLAYTWRSAYLAGLSQSQGANEPVNTAAYGQLDGSISYELSKAFVVFIDATNMTGASVRQYGRFEDQFLGYYKGAPRLQFGVRAKF